MTAMNRRSLLRGVAAAAIGCTLIPSVAESAPRIGNELAPQKPHREDALVLAQTSTTRRHRRRRQVCWWDGERRRCSWR